MLIFTSVRAMQWLSLCVPGVYTEYMSECIDKPEGGARGDYKTYIIYDLTCDEMILTPLCGVYTEYAHLIFGPTGR